MYNIGVVWRNRNDFEFKCYCRFCKYVENRFGYADDYFQYGILPSWHCPKCGKNEDGLTEQQVQENKALEAQMHKTHQEIIENTKHE